MRKKLAVPIGLLAAVVAGLALLSAGPTVSQELQDVRILNFPDPQRVEGTVAVEGPVRSAELVRFSDVTVSPVLLEDTTRLVHAGTLEADGYGHVLLSLVCQARGASDEPGTVGVLLVPAEKPVREAFIDHGKALATLQLDARVDSGPPTFFASQGPRQPLAFPRYEVYLYNATKIAVRASVYAYVSNG